MAKGGGGSWKVAYADFVTAMMAFFLVMWIGAQDTKVRQSVANYFVDPSGVAKKPVQTGAVLDSMVYGNMPKQDSVAMGQGTRSFSTSAEMSPTTKTLSEWISSDPKRLSYWRDKAQECRKKARALNLSNPNQNPEEIAGKELSNLLQADIRAGVPAETKDIYLELLVHTLKDVNWAQLSEHLLNTSDQQ